MSQKETTRVITSSSDKLHQTEGEEMNEELLNGSFQLLILQLKPGAFFSLQILRITISVRERLLCEVESGIPFCHQLYLGISTLKSPLTCQSLRSLPAQGLNPCPQSSYQSHKMELDPPLVVAHRETPATAVGWTGTDGGSPLPLLPPKPAHPRQLTPFHTKGTLMSQAQQGLHLCGLIQLQG